MLKRVIPLAFIIVVLSTLFFSAPANAFDSSFIIQNYDVKISVGLDNSYTVTESLDVNFTAKNLKHGIQRYLPLRNAESGGFVTISDIQVLDEAFTTSEKSNNLIINIADMNKYVYGLKHYVISYKFSPGKDTNSSYDFLSFNVIPYGFDVVIQKANVEITMPKPFDSSQLTVFSGNYGTISNENNIVPTVKGEKITMLSGPFGPKQGITIRSQLPEGYYSQATYPFGYMLLMYIPIIAIPLLLLALLLWYKFGRDEKIIPVIAFNSPRKFNPAEIGYLIDQTVDSEDISALTIYWASHGHITIEEFENTYTLHLVTPLDEAHKPYEKLGFQKMFELGTGTSVSKEDLENSFFATAAKMKLEVPLYYEIVQPDLIERSSSIVSNFITALSFILNAVFLVFPLRYYWGEKGFLIFAGISIAIQVTIAVLFNLFGKAQFKMKMSSKIFAILGLSIAGLLFCVANLIFNLLDGVTIWPIPQMLVMSLTSITMLFMANLIKKRSKYMTEVLQEILGFKDFLETAEKEKLEMLIKDNPKYFFDTIPYAMVLGVTAVWGEKFNDIVREPPDWYTNRSNGMFMPSIFALSMMNYNHGLAAAAVSTPNSSAGGSGGFSGGGFSGGGSFGGGGFGGGGGGSI